MEDIHNVDASREYWEVVVDERSFKARQQQRKAADEGLIDMMGSVRVKCCGVSRA